MSSTLALLGCGDLGTALGLRLLAAGQNVLAVRRGVHRLPAELPSLALDYSDPAGLEPLREADADRFLFTPTPASRDSAGYEQGFLRPVENLLSVLAGGPPRRILFTSSTRVYGEDDGGWVDESTPACPGDAQGDVILAAERLLLDSHHRVTVVRFAGIYGRLPSALLDRVERGEVCPPVPVLYSNRIHREDCIGFLEHLLCGVHRPEPLYLGVDDLPVPRHEVERWLAAEMGGHLPPGGVERRGASMRGKRCRNELLKESGYRLKYPDYRVGYREVLDRRVTGPG